MGHEVTAVSGWLDFESARSPGGAERNPGIPHSASLHAGYLLVYMVYSDRIIEGSPKNSTSVPIMPWGPSDQIQRCGDFVEK